MKNYIATVTILVTCILSVSAQRQKILIVSTNRDSVGVNASGTFLKEIAFPFQHFTDQGFEVDVVTPKGGKAAIYHWGATPENLDRIQKNDLFKQKTSTTLSPNEVITSSYSAVFYPGGHGQYFDVIADERIAKITALIYENGGVIGTAGHGAASLIDIRLSDGKYLVQGKRMTCFPHWAELAFMNISAYGKLLPFDMEEVLGRRGANVIVCTKENRSNNDLTLVVDRENRIVTGAFANGAPWVAEQMVVLLNSRKPGSETDGTLVLKAVDNYVQGRNNGDINQLKAAFTSNATLQGIDTKTGEQSITPIADYLKRNAQGSKHDCETDVRLLNFINDIATVQVTFRYPDYSYNDYLTLMKLKGNWIITSKVHTKTQQNP